MTARTGRRGGEGAQQEGRAQNETAGMLRGCRSGFGIVNIGEKYFLRKKRKLTAKAHKYWVIQGVEEISQISKKRWYNIPNPNGSEGVVAHASSLHIVEFKNRHDACATKSFC